MTARFFWLSKALLLLGFVLFLSGPLEASDASFLPANPATETAVKEPGDSIEGLLEEILRRYDTNGDGKLDPGERHRMLLDILRDRDPSKPAVIEKEDFIAWLLRLGYTPNTALNLWLQLLQEADRNGDGIIDIKEWTEFLRRHGLVQVYVLVPVSPEEIDPAAVIPAELFPSGQDGSLYDDSDFLLEAAKGEVQK